MNPLIIVFGILIAVFSASIGLLIVEMFERTNQPDDYPFFD